jgi:hypothetical protein
MIAYSEGQLVEQLDIFPLPSDYAARLAELRIRNMKGFPRANLMYMRAFPEAWPNEAIVQQAVGQLPWEYNLAVLADLQTGLPGIETIKQARADGIGGGKE